MYAGVSIPTEALPSGTDSSLPTIDATKKNLHLSIKEFLEINEVRPDVRVRGGNSRERTTGVNRRDAVRTVPAAPILMEEGTLAGHWQNNSTIAPRARTMTTGDYHRTRTKLIYYLCYIVGTSSGRDRAASNQ